MKKPGLEEQIDEAQKFLHANYRDLPLAPLPEQPIPFPGGWRIPYSLYYTSPQGIFRLCGSLLVLFFKPASDPLLATWEVSVEWDELSQHEERKEGLRKFSQFPALQFIPLHRIYQTAINDAVTRIEKIEMVLNDGRTGNWQPYARVSMSYNNGTYSEYLVIALDPEEGGYCKIPQSSSSHTSWSLGCIKRDNNGTMHIDPAHGDVSIHETTEFTIWACQYAIEDFFQQIGYTDLDTRNIITQYNISGFAKSCVHYIDGLSVITFTQDSVDPSIVLHEFAHALWYQFYVFRPANLVIDPKFGGGWRKSIEEGFADYFSGRLLLGKNATSLYTIGGYFNIPVAREITGDYQRPDDDAPVHEIGNQWANLLWNLRRHLLRSQSLEDTLDIDRLILYAHFKPCLCPDDSFTDPFDCYYASIRQTAENMNLELQGWEISRKKLLGQTI